MNVGILLLWRCFFFFLFLSYLNLLFWYILNRIQKSSSIPEERNPILQCVTVAPTANRHCRQLTLFGCDVLYASNSKYFFFNNNNNIMYTVLSYSILRLVGVGLRWFPTIGAARWPPKKEICIRSRRGGWVCIIICIHFRPFGAAQMRYRRRHRGVLNFSLNVPPSRGYSQLKHAPFKIRLRRFCYLKLARHTVKDKRITGRPCDCYHKLPSSKQFSSNAHA